MNRKTLLTALPAALLILGTGAANAGKTIEEAGALACVIDKWDEKEPEKGHKLVNSVARCVDIPNDPAQPKYSQQCPGKYEYMPDGSWKPAARALTPTRMETRNSNPGRRVRPSRTTRTSHRRHRQI